MSYKNRLKELRKAAGLTQRDICDQTGIKLGTYRAWEQGVSQLRLDDALTLSKALSCDPNTLAGWYESHPKTKEKPLLNEEQALDEKKTNLRLLALRGDMNQAEFAAKLGISQRVYSNYENGQELKSALIRTICRVCGCSAEWLLGFDDDSVRSLSQQECALISDFRACSTDDRLLILKTARNAAELRKNKAEMVSLKEEVVSQ